jgi:hypothetical protein
MKDLTVENMFTDNSYEVKRLISGGTLGALDRKRMLEHVIADVVSAVLSAPGSNPVGLAVTVTLKASPFGESKPDLLVTATAPQYDLSDDFFN